MPSFPDNSLFNKLPPDLYNQIPVESPKSSPLSFINRKCAILQRKFNQFIDKIATCFARVSTKPQEARIARSALMNTHDIRLFMSIRIEGKAEGKFIQKNHQNMMGIARLFADFINKNDNMSEREKQGLKKVQDKIQNGLHYALRLPSKSPSSEKLAKSLLDNLSEKPVIIPLGYATHIVGVEIEKKDNRIFVRISNVGDGCEHHKAGKTNDDKDLVEPTLTYECEDEDAAKELVTNLFQVFREGKSSDELYGCFARARVTKVQEPVQCFRPMQEMGNCAVRNPLEAIFNAMLREGVDPSQFQRHIYSQAEEASKGDDIYQELADAAQNKQPPEFYYQEKPEFVAEAPKATPYARKCDFLAELVKNQYKPKNII